LVAPDIGLILQSDVVSGQRPISGPEGQSASSASTASSSSLLTAEIQTQTESQASQDSEKGLSEAKVPSYTVYKSGSKTIKVPHFKMPSMEKSFPSFKPPVKEIRACFENKSIAELEASILAGFARLGEEMNATRALFSIPLPKMDPPELPNLQQPTLQVQKGGLFCLKHLLLA
jgi:hypothetical protein